MNLGLCIVFIFFEIYCFFLLYHFLSLTDYVAMFNNKNLYGHVTAFVVSELFQTIGTNNSMTATIRTESSLLLLFLYLFHYLFCVLKYPKYTQKTKHLEKLP